MGNEYILQHICFLLCLSEILITGNCKLANCRRIVWVYLTILYGRRLKVKEPCEVSLFGLVFFTSIVSKWLWCFNFRFHSVAKAQKLLKWINCLVAKRPWLLWQWYLQFKNAIQHRFIYLMKLIRHWILFTENPLEVSLQFEHLLLPIKWICCCILNPGQMVILRNISLIKADLFREFSFKRWYNQLKLFEQIQTFSLLLYC